MSKWFRPDKLFGAEAEDKAKKAADDFKEPQTNSAGFTMAEWLAKHNKMSLALWPLVPPTEDEMRDFPTERRNTEIIAWRAWGLVEGPDGRPLLHSFQGTAWDGPALTADAVPDLNNSNGIYAMAGRAMGGIDHAQVYGSVALSGRVIEHKAGYRAQRAVVRSLTLNPPTVDRPHSKWTRQEVANSLAERYGVDVELAPWSKEDESAYRLTLAKKRQLEYAEERLQRALVEYGRLAGILSPVVALVREYVRPQMFITDAERVSIEQPYHHSQFYNYHPATIVHHSGLRISIEGNVLRAIDVSPPSTQPT